MFKSQLQFRRYNRIFGFTGVVLFLAVLMGLVPPAGAADPIKIGLIGPITGSRAQIGGDIEAGVKVYLDQIGYTMEGRKIELIIEDEGKPTTAIAKTRKLINHDKVDIMLGLFSSSSAYAVAPLTTEANIPLVITGSAGDNLTQRKRSPNIIRVNVTGSQAGHTAAEYAYKELGWRNIAVIGWEHAFGQETVGSFQKAFEDAGGKVVQRTYVPRKTLDFSPYVANLKRDVDGLYAVITGAPNMRFLRALKARGLMNNWKVLTVLSATDESFLQEMGAIGDGVLSVNSYSVVLDLPENAAFIKQAKKSTDREISGVMMDAYVGAKWIHLAVKKVKGNVEDKTAFNKALHSVEMPDSPHGKIELDAYGQAIQNIYVRKVEKVNGRWQNTVVFTYPDVSQFGNYDPAAYLKSPTYGPDNPPCTFCK